jgi:hypothetical protein
MFKYDVIVKLNLQIKQMKKLLFIFSILFIASCAPNDNQSFNLGRMHEKMLSSEMNIVVTKSSLAKKNRGLIILSVTAKNRNFKANTKPNKGAQFFNKVKNLSKNTVIPKISKFQMTWLKDSPDIENIFNSKWFHIARGSAGQSDFPITSMAGIKSDVSNKEYRVFSVEEGTYNLLNIEVFNSHMLFSGDNNWVSRGNFAETLASLKINRGEVLYLGDLDVFYSNLNIDRTQNHKKLKIEVQNNFKQAKKYLQKYHPQLSKKIKPQLLEGDMIVKKY